MSNDVSQPPPCECQPPAPGERIYCQRHKMYKTLHRYELCKNRAHYRARWDRKAAKIPDGPAEPDGPEGQVAPQEPGLLRKAVNFSRAVSRHIADGARKVGQENYEQRLAICRACPSCDVPRMVCRERRCGCRLPVKARWRSESCPRGKWPAVAREEPTES